MEFKYGFFGELPKIGLTVFAKGGSVSVPGPTPEETAIRKKQLEIMEKEQDWMTMFEPMVLDAMGYKKDVTDTTSQTETPEYQAWKSNYDKIMGGESIQGDSRYGYMDNTEGGVRWTPYSKDQMISNLGTAPTQYSTSGGKTETLRRMTDDERLAAMTPTERSDYEIQRKLQQRQLDALEGNLPISPGLESSIQTEQQSLEDELATTRGPMWRLGANTKLGEFKKRAELVREEARRGMLDTTSALSLAQGNKVESNAANTINRGGALPNMWGGLMSGYNTAIQPYQQDRQYQISAAMQSQANKAAQTGGLMNLAGSLGGAGMMALALSSPKFKKNIKKADDEEVLDMVDKTGTYEYNYKGEKDGTPKRLGYMADEAPAGTDVNETYLDLGKVSGFHSAAIKAMAKKIDKLEKAVKGN